jgi:hypothetical protein
LAWLVGILATATVALPLAKAPEWLLALLAIFLTISIGLYLFAYLYCLFRDRDALRSERYSLHKMAIEHGIYGDSTSGIIDPPNRKRRGDRAGSVCLNSFALEISGFLPGFLGWSDTHLGCDGGRA